MVKQVFCPCPFLVRFCVTFLLSFSECASSNLRLVFGFHQPKVAAPHPISSKLRNFLSATMKRYGPRPRPGPRQPFVIRSLSTRIQTALQGDALTRCRINLPSPPHYQGPRVMAAAADPGATTPSNPPPPLHQNHTHRLAPSTKTPTLFTNPPLLASIHPRLERPCRRQTFSGEAF